MLYIKENVENMLREHQKNESKLTEVQLKLEEYNERLHYAGTVYEDTEEEIIENMQLAGQPYDSIHSNTNKISDKVSNTAEGYKKEEIHINKENINFLERKIAEYTDIKDELNKKIVRVKNMIEPLSKEEKFVIKVYYMEKSKWNYLEDEFENNFKVHKSTKQLQTYRDNAIKSMLETLNVGED